MVFWKRKLNQSEGFSLVEALAAITILGLVVVPIYSSMMLSYRLNLHSERTLQAQLAVSAAVETIMAEGYDTSADYAERFSNVKIEIDVDNEDYTPGTDVAIPFKITAKDPNDPEKTLEDISVTTWARPYKDVTASDDEGGDNNDE